MNPNHASMVHYKNANYFPHLKHCAEKKTGQNAKTVYFSQEFEQQQQNQ